MTRRTEKIPFSLLILDDRREVTSALVRYLKLDFEHVFGEVDPAAARRVLQGEAPEFLLTDYWLGPGYPPATEWIPRWRREFPCLQRVVLMSGTNSSSIPDCPEVDARFAKPLRVAQLVDYFAEQSRALQARTEAIRPQA